MPKDSNIQCCVTFKIFNVCAGTYISSLLSFNVYNSPLFGTRTPRLWEIEYTTPLIFLFLYNLFLSGTPWHLGNWTIYCVHVVCSLFDRSQCITQKLWYTEIHWADTLSQTLRPVTCKTKAAWVIHWDTLRPVKQTKLRYTETCTNKRSLLLQHFYRAAYPKNLFATRKRLYSIYPDRVSGTRSTSGGLGFRV